MYYMRIYTCVYGLGVIVPYRSNTSSSVRASSERMKVFPIVWGIVVCLLTLGTIAYTGTVNLILILSQLSFYGSLGTYVHHELAYVHM